jgi:hypothetical protein
MAINPGEGVGVTTSQTWNAFPPVELGRSGGTIAQLTRISGGTGYSNGTLATTTDSNNGTGATVTVTQTGGIVAAANTVANGGDGYRLGDVLTLVGGDNNATFRVTKLSYTN